MKKTLAIMLALIMVLALVPSVAFAEGSAIYVSNTGDDTTGKGTQDSPYATLAKAVEVAKTGETTTIQLGEGEYTLWIESESNNASSTRQLGWNKNLIFIGQGANKTTYHIGAKDTAHPDGPCDYSLDGRGTDMKETVTFKDMTIDAGKYPKAQTERAYLHGLAGIDNIVLDNCIFNGIASYWGYATTKFNNVIFNAPGTEASGIKDVDYSLWTWTGTEYTFNNCTFNSAGKVINAYRGDGGSTAETPVVLNFNDCKVFSSDANKSVLNIKDANNYYTVNISGTNTVKGLNPDKRTCSRLFQVEGYADNYNLSGGEGNNKNCQATVTIDGTTVWTGGKMVGHAIDTTNDHYTDGYKDNKFDIITISDGIYVKKCIYCGYTEPFYGELSNEIGLTRTVMQGQEVNANPKDTYKVNGSSNITVDYTATMDMTKLEWKEKGSLYDDEITPWQMLAMQPGWITEDTVVFLKFTFDKNIDLGTFQTNYNNATTSEAKEKLLKLESNMFKIADEGGVQFDIEKREMTIKCNWNWNKETGHAPEPKITLNGYGLPVANDWNGSKQINIENSGCVSGTVHIKYINPRPDAKKIAEIVHNVAANVQVQNTTPPEISPTIQIPIVGGCKTDEFTLYYGGGSSGDSGGSSSGGGYYHPTTTPVPVIVIPPKTGDMTVWQSILHFLGIK